MTNFIRFCCTRIPQRFVMYVMSLSSLAICLLERCIYLRVVEEFVDVYQDEVKTDNQPESCLPMFAGFERGKAYRFVWTSQQKLATNQAFYVGYIISVIPGGVLADFYGGRRVVMAGILLATLATFSSLSLQIGYKCVMVSRFILGIGQGLTIPGTTALIANWAAYSEICTAVAIMNSGQTLGLCSSYWFNVLCNVFTCHWQVSFTTIGTLGIIWLIFWGFFCFDTPSSNPYISQNELEFINQQFLQVNRIKDRPQYPYIPWKQIFSSRPALSLMGIYFSCMWFTHTCLTLLPSYFKLHVKMSESLVIGFVHANVTAFTLQLLFWGFMSDWMVDHKYMDRTTNRKFVTLLAQVVLLVSLLGILLAGCRVYIVAGLYVVFGFSLAPIFSVLSANVLDLTVDHAGFLQGILGTTEALSVLVSSQIYYCICLKQNNDPSSWTLFFIITTVMTLVLTVPYAWFGSAEPQPWAAPSSHPPPPLPSPPP